MFLNEKRVSAPSFLLMRRITHTDYIVSPPIYQLLVWNLLLTSHSYQSHQKRKGVTMRSQNRLLLILILLSGGLCLTSASAKADSDICNQYLSIATDKDPFQGSLPILEYSKDQISIFGTSWSSNQRRLAISIAEKDGDKVAICLYEAASKKSSAKISQLLDT